MGWDAEKAQEAADAMSWSERKRIEAEADREEAFRQEEERLKHDMQILAEEEDPEDGGHPHRDCHKDYAHYQHIHMLDRNFYFCSGKLDLPSFDKVIRRKARMLVKQKELFNRYVNHPVVDALANLPEGAQLPPGKYIIRGTRTGRIGEPTLPYDYVIDQDGEIGVTMQYNNDLTRRIEALQAQLDQLQKQQAFLKMLPKEPWHESYSTPVVYFEKQFPASPGHIYQYIAIRTQGGWDVSGRQGPKSQTWHELLLWLMETSPNHELPALKISWADEWETIANPSKELEQ